jgi:hypothetical protein
MSENIKENNGHLDVFAKFIVCVVILAGLMNCVFSKHVFYFFPFAFFSKEVSVSVSE